MSAIVNEATLAQRRAADPTASAWVAASAGTGKTKVLTDRVLRLLLAENPPRRLLCLTFTKAAAAEMANRIARRLATWATAEEEDLARDLTELLGGEPGRHTLVEARRLFARVLDAPGGMRIDTIHAFCQSLLRQFPLEAGLAPHFRVMDDRDAGELLAAARETVLAGARDHPASGLAEALGVVTRSVHESNFDPLMAELVGERGRLAHLFDRHGSLEAVAARVHARLGLVAGETAEQMIAAACADLAFDAAGCRRAVDALRNGKASDAERAAAMAAWLADVPSRPATFARWRSTFLTNDGEIRQRLCTKDVDSRCPGTLAVLQAEAERLLAVADRLRALTTAAASLALLRLGHAILDAYGEAKAARALVDYDDLIHHTIALLERPGVPSWVLYKLDGGIDHLLIDEAQDTNPDQWRVVRALTGEFFAGRGQKREGRRTVFAVGDAKQSIYSFQRADPREFEAMRGLLAQAVPAAHGRWDEVALQVSFRSTTAVLDAVDMVVNSPEGGDGVVAPGQTVHHLAKRQGMAGLVEVWPPAQPRPQDEPEAWKPPVERHKGDSPRTRLARLVAARIQVMVGGERLESKDRPIRPGDILVLVRRRNAFVEELVRELKTLGVGVAGADRMVLTDQLAVMDLMALGNALLLPEDDLTLATVLKGPLVGLSEEALFDLAWNRPGSLWQALAARAGEPPYAAAWEWLSELLAMADRQPPHDLFAHVLNGVLNGAAVGASGKQRLLARLGPEAEDPIDEFISLSLAYERLHPPSLQGFLRWLEEGGVEIKRDLDAGPADAVRIMTVHGAKGLQAPIVFLPDTLQAPTRPPRLLWLDDDEAPLVLWPPRAADHDAVCRAARDAANCRRDQEYRRLLYVAMTRAEDRLIVCGWATRRAAPGHCWYNLVEAALATRCDAVDDPFLAARPEADGRRLLRFATAQTAAPEAAAAAPPEPVSAALPDWARRPPLAEPTPPRPLAPSRPDDAPPVRSPLAGEGAARFRRGRLIHRLMQTLPDVAESRRPGAAARFLGRPAWGLSYAEQADIAAEVGAVLADSRFARLFGPGSRAEVPVVGLVGERVVSGQVDRLLVTAGEVLVIDYKTDRPPPADPAAVAPVYLRQMAAYRAALACIYPGRRIRCALLWTDGPRLMELDSRLLDDLLG
jgi:ATP-dependent helicase/nuclease subunit A